MGLLLKCEMTLLKAAMLVSNFVVFSLGTACLGIGIWLAVSQSSLFNLVKQVSYVVGQDLMGQSQNTYLQMGSYVLIACGVLAMLVGFCGLWGTIKSSNFFILLYMALCVLVVIFLFASGILAAKFQATISSSLQMAATSALNSNFDGLVNSKNLMTTTWFYVMQTYQCCGMNGVGDFTTTYNQSANTWYNYYREYCTNGTCYHGNQVLIPVSCCKFGNNDNTMQWQMLDPLCPITMNVTSFNMQGCAVAISSWANTGAAVLIGVSFGLPNFILLALFGAEKLRLHGQIQLQSSS